MAARRWLALAGLAAGLLGPGDGTAEERFGDWVVLPPGGEAVCLAYTEGRPAGRLVLRVERPALLSLYIAGDRRLADGSEATARIDGGDPVALRAADGLLWPEGGAASAGFFQALLLGAELRVVHGEAGEGEVFSLIGLQTAREAVLEGCGAAG
ncbi:MAG: hypothetical protein AAGE18_03160 [Pseudomonadota bacterium]